MAKTDIGAKVVTVGNGGAADTAAICAAVPLETEFVVTTALRLPTESPVTPVTVRVVAVAAVTVPEPEGDKATLLWLATESKPKPLIVMEVALVKIAVAAEVTTGLTVATWTGAPLLTKGFETTAVSDPAVVGLVEKVTVNEVVLPDVTVPTAPSLKVTVLLAGTGSKAVPVMTIEVAVANKLDADEVTLGAVGIVTV